jgi:hypothetical protein
LGDEVGDVEETDQQAEFLADELGLGGDAVCGGLGNGLEGRSVYWSL